MSETRFTPGPWDVRAGRSCLHVVSEDNMMQTGCISFRGNGEANARLIAAAPELYAACKELAALVADEARHSDISTDQQCALELATRALAKADGR